jgi:hypothetical protein
MALGPTPARQVYSPSHLLHKHQLYNADRKIPVGRRSTFRKEKLDEFLIKMQSPQEA